PGEALFVFNMIIGDGVVIWRTWVIYQEKKLAIAMPCTLLLAAFVFALMDITCNSYDGRPGPTPLPGAQQICGPSATIVWSLSVATNMTCTLLIASKAWCFLMRELGFPRKSRRMTTEKILSILLESGFIYSLLLLALCIDYLPISRDSPWFYLGDVLNPMGHQMAGMYPTLIIVIVNFKRTIWED
ncbi:hypothetical protein K438DRAFT_1529863, partial [Mycena galopus ATCC 62051]